jgi:acyl-CoA synthetase (AMP-forming)/AMP-acid ligase II
VSIARSHNFFRALDQHANHVALITGDGACVTYREMLAAADHVAASVEQRRLAFLVCRNDLESVVGYVGLLRAGAAVALVRDSLDDELFARLLDDYRPEYIFGPPRRRFPAGYSTTATYGGHCLATGATAEHAIHEELALLMSTSGTTGTPKMVRQSFRNIESNALAIASYLEIDSSHRAITTMPMSYSYGLSILNSHLLAGASVVLNESSVVDRRFWDLARSSETTSFGGVPYMYATLKKLNFAKMELPALKYITQAGGKLDPDLALELAELCAARGIRFYVMYGQTEATARIAYLPWTHARLKPSSIGLPIPGGRLRLEDDDGSPIEAGGVPGELVYEGANVSLGYSCRRADLAKGDENRGVLRTGDIAVRDADGFYYIVGRKARFLKLFGSRVSLDDIEQWLGDAGYECACAGTDDCLRVYVARLHHPEFIRDFIARRTGINRVAISVVSVDDIPLNDSGKIRYAALG